MRMRAVLALALIAPLSTSVLATRTNASHADCGIAAWTGTCSCTLRPGRRPLSYRDYATLLATSAEAQHLLAEARAACGMPALNRT
jgi:hypothetical protein